jgi:hypothetical protein
MDENDRIEGLFQTSSQTYSPLIVPMDRVLLLIQSYTPVATPKLGYETHSPYLQEANSPYLQAYSPSITFQQLPTSNFKVPSYPFTSDSNADSLSGPVTPSQLMGLTLEDYSNLSYQRRSEDPTRESKESHKDAEKKRRDTLKSAFDELKLTLNIPLDKSTPRSAVLARGICY